MDKFPDWFIIVLGAVLIFGGYRSIKKRQADTDVGNWEGPTAVKIGWFWVVLGIFFWLAILFDIEMFRAAIQFFLENKD
jgi:hypothetical protein